MTNSMDKLIKLANDINPDSIWLWFSADGSDRMFDLHLSRKYSSPTYGFIASKGVKLLVSELDSDIDSGFEKHIYHSARDIDHKLAFILERYDWPMNIYLNYSKSGDHKVDSLGHGQYIKLTRRIRDIYKASGRTNPNFKSAEDFLYLLIERRSAQEISNAKIAAVRAQTIMRHCFSNVCAGMSEKDILRLFHNYTESTRTKFLASVDAVKEEYSWESEACPIILVGPNLAKGGHAEASDYRLKAGETLYADFGVKLTFEDESVVSSDLQRMAFLPADPDSAVPDEILHVFTTLYSSITAGLEILKPGVAGYTVDAAVRDIIISEGFPNYNHATGHPVAEVAHSPGTLLAPKDNPRGRKKIQPQGTYTIEPRCQVENGGSIEEMAVATPNGGETLCERQSELWIIRK